MANNKLFLGVFSVIDVALVAVYYTLAAILIVAVLQNYIHPVLHKYNQHIEEQSNLTLVSSVCIEASVIGVLAYFLRKIVMSLPSPLKMVRGYGKFHSEEVNGGFLIGFLVIRGGLVDDFKDKLEEIIKRLNRGISTYL